MAVVALIAAAFVAFAPTPAAQAAGSPCGATINPIVCENQKPGTDPDVWDVSGAGDSSIQGFATDISVNAGSKIDFKIDTDASAYTIDIYRTGWYQGLGARFITSVPVTAPLPQHQPQCISEASTGLYDCGTWGVSASWDVPTSAVSGVYIAKLTRSNGDASHITFIVRKDGNTSDVFFQTSDTTWHAYNTYGGANFYQGGANNRAYKLSYNRPFATRDSTDLNSPSGDTQRDFYFDSEYPTVRFLERNGYDVSYTTDIDTDRRGSELLNHKVFLSVGHDEYWSGAQRANMEAARDAGVNFQFLTGNEGYWRVRWESSVDGSHTPYRTLVTYKETWAYGKIDPDEQWTGTSRDPRYATSAQGAHNPENALTGTMYMVNDIDLPMKVTSEEGKLRVWRNAGLSNIASGTSVSLGDGILGYETNEDVDNGFRPAGLIRMSTTVAPTTQYLRDYGNVVAAGTTQHHITLYRAPSGALVFSAGTIRWGWGLDDVHDGRQGTSDSRIQQATVNLLADMGAQPSTLMSGLFAATKSTDTTAPTTTITSPAAGQAIPNGTAVTVTGTASDVGGRVAGVEVSTDGGTTWRRAEGTTSWTFTYVQQGDGAQTITARAIDDSANYSSTGVSRAITVGGPYSALGNATPANPSTDDSQAVELGLRFSTELDGYASGVRFYKGAGNLGQHVGSLWDEAGVRLATVTFATESATGWQTARFSSPVPIIAGQTYTVSYTAPQGGYAYQERYWPYNARPSSPVKVTSATGANTAGVYGVAGQFPTSTWSDANYFVDVEFTKSDTSPLRIQLRTPGAGAASVALDAPVTATLTRPATPESVGLTIKDPSGATVPGTVTYDSATRVIRFVPTGTYAPSTAYTVTPVAQDAAGVGLAPDSGWTFTTRADGQSDGQCPCSLFDESRVPAIQSDSDTSSVTLGVGFTVAIPGKISALKFFKGPGNMGAHVGTLWDDSGTALATVDFTNESASGWQKANLSTPVTVQPGVRYVVSYRASQGGYSATPATFAQEYTRGPLTVAAAGSVFTYSNGFPTQSSTTDYGVDVVFQPLGDSPVLTSSSPAAGATAVAANAPISATFSGALRGGYTGTVKANGSPVAGSWSLSGDKKTLSFTPSAPYSSWAQVSVAITGIVSESGVAGADVGWSFTAVGSATIFSLLGAATPAQTEASDTASVELGMSFTTASDGNATAIRFYKSTSNTGTHVGSIWNAAGERLAQATFVSETASGWQRVVLQQPVALTAGQVYTVSYLAPRGGYSYTGGYFAAPVSSGPLTAVSPANGVFRYGDGAAMPTSTWNSTNYFVDLEFVPDSQGETPLAVESTSPADAATAVAIDAPIAATLNRDAAGQSVGITVVAGGAETEGEATYNAVTRTVSFQPDSALAYATSYTATVTLGGLGLHSWTFESVGPPASGEVQTLFGDASPTVASVAETDPVELGTAFTVAKAGNVTALRYYKGEGSTGTHRGTLWTSTGQELAHVTFENESASGWQRAVLSTPTLVKPGVTYVVSYFAPNGGYGYTSGYFSQARVSGDITGPSTDNGRFFYGANGGFPTSSWGGSAYFADVEIDFGPPPTVVPPSAPALSSRTPSADATGVSTTTVINATVAHATSATMAVSTGGTAVAGASTFDAATGVVSFVPTEALARGKTYLVSVSVGQQPVADGTWSFSTLAAPSISNRTPAQSATNVDPATATLSATLVNATAASMTLSSGGAAVPGSSGFDPSTGTVTFVPAASLQWGKTYELSVTADGAAVTGGVWSFSTLPVATLTATTPAAGASTVDPATAQVTATLTGAVNATLSLNAGANAVAGTSSFNASTGVVTFTPTAPLDRAKTYTATVSANGTAVASGTWSFTTIANPAITARTPGSSATGVLVNAPITATISNASSAAISVATGGAAVAGASSFNVSTGVVTFTPAAALGFSRTYSVTATANGAALAGGTWSFTTIAQATRTSSSPASGATNVNPSALTITATLSSGAQAGAITLAQGATNIAGTSTYNATTRVASFVPAAALDWTKTYTATVTANGGAVTGGTWSFTTMAKPDQVSLFATGTPTNSNASAVLAYQVGTRFRTSAPGVVTTIKYYKGTLNTGTHTGYLRSATGTVLAQVTFQNETSSGWQSALLSSPVRLTVGTEYRVTLYSSSGRYAVTDGALASSVTVAPLSTVANGGVAGFGTSNPTNISSNKYWVDVIFDPDN
ncbi:DUF4082 domain-containing protein [Microbacterium trichothecenolyticum]|uniref:DUF4082 domain-containing protein n=1 Tax=Microbacterium trichothecenolyticum TaxID=69370 RepID=UPI0006967D36|nr:DUF4082 domain-containing protein [Microbacterium trichothecenolyticum]